MSLMEQILGEITDVLQRSDDTAISRLAQAVFQAPRIFVVGEGRSGLMAKAFAMRLMHLGAMVYVVGETITPAIEAGDLIIGISGSGTTEQVVRTIQKAGQHGVITYAVTADSASTLASSTTDVLVIPAATKHRREGEHQTIQPLGSLFDQSVHVMLDAVCLVYANLQREDNEGALGRHSNLE